MEEPASGPSRSGRGAPDDERPEPGGTDGRDGHSRADRPAAAPGGDRLPPGITDGFDALPAPVLVVDEAGTVLYANDATERRLGYDPSALVGRGFGVVCPDLSVEALATHADPASDETLEARGRTADDTAVQLALDVGRRRTDGQSAYVAVVHDVTAAREREHRLAQFERIVQTIDDGVYVLDDAFNITAVNDAVEDLTGYDRSELVGANATMLASEETLSQAAAVSEALLSGDGEAATLSTSIETADGEAVPIETRFSVYPFGDGSYGQVGVVRDVSDRIWYEQTLRTLHDSTRELLGADTPEAVCDLVVEMATEAIDLSAAVVYRFDSDVNRLRPSSRAGAVPVDLPSVTAGDGAVWRAFVEGDRQVVDASRDADDRDETDDEAAESAVGSTRDHASPTLAPDGVTALSAETGVAIPLSDHGVFFLAMDERERLDPDTAQLTDLVAASAEAALERVDRDQRLRERERELRERNQRLRRLERINEVIRRIDEAMIEAESRAEVESAVCAELARSPLFSLAWLGRANDETVAASARAGDADRYLDAVDRSLAGEGGPPAVRTARSGSVTHVPTVAEDLRTEPWRVEAVSRGFQSALSVPVATDGVTYGVLTLYADESDAFPERVRTVVGELAASVADALRAVETKQWLSAERVVELEVRVTAPSSPLVRLAAAADCRFEHEGTLSLSSDRVRTFLRVAGTDPASVRDAAAGLTAVRSVDALADGDDGRIMAELTPPTVATTVTDLGARVRSLAVDGEGVDCTATLPTTADVRSVVETLGGRFDGATLLRRTERGIATRTVGEFRAAIRDALTERQWQVLRTAYLSGFFEWPRTTTGEEVAETFDLSQPTINRHLRLSQRRLLDLVFDEEESR